MGCLRCISRVKSFHVKILLLDKQELIQEVTEKTTGQDLLDNVFKYLNLIETAYFGLRYQDNDNQTVSLTDVLKTFSVKFQIMYNVDYFVCHHQLKVSLFHTILD